MVAAIFVATFTRSTLGFGEALIGVPLLALVIPIQVAAPVAVLVSITVAAVVVVQDWRHIHLRSAASLLLPSIFGIPLGLYVLAAAPSHWVKIGLALFIMGFSIYSLLSHGRFALADDKLAWVFGFCAGVLGGAYGMNGPPLAAYGTLRGWSPQHFRATLQAYFFPASLLVMAGYAYSGLWVQAVNRYYLAALPGVLLAMFLGRAANRRLRSLTFVRVVHLGLVAIGAALLFSAV
ncbi:MAG: sulfite exporter TauE/SafE family protein [Thiomonas sp.]